MSSKDKILASALKLFEENGYNATTLAIAKDAGVSEMTVFRNFSTKENLFFQVVKKLTLPGNISNLQQEITGDIEKDLETFGEKILTFFITKEKLIKMMMFEATKQTKITELLEAAPMENIKTLSQYFQKQMDLGNIKTSNPNELAELFLSMLFGYAIGISTFKNGELNSIEVEKYTKLAVNSLLNGIK